MWRRLLWFAVSLLLAHCADVSTLQTARTIPKGTVRAVIGGGYFESLAANDAASSASSSDVSLKFPFLNGQMRFGIADHFDVGGRITFPGQLGADGKFQFVDAGGFGAAIGLGVSYLALAANFDTSSTSGSSSDSYGKLYTTFLDVTIPAYLSYDISESFAPYVSPKVMFRFISGSTPVYMGVTGGIKLGNKWGLFAEGTYMRATMSGVTDQIAQFNFGIFFGSATTYPTSRDVVDPPPPRDTASVATTNSKPHVMKVSGVNPKFLLISSTWPAGKRVCVMRGGKPIACGKIKKPLARGAIMELDKAGAKIKEGDEIR